MREDGKDIDEAVDASMVDSPWGDVLLGAIFLLFSILMFIGAQFFTYRTQMGFVTAAAFTPIVLSIIVAILSGFLIIGALRKPKSRSIGRWAGSVIADDRTHRSLVMAVLTAIYVVAVGRINFLVVNLVYLFVAYRYLKVGSMWKVAVLSIVNAAIVGVVVPRIFQMPLP